MKFCPMSLICFRGHSILPPLVIHENRKFDDKCIEKQHLKKKYVNLKSNIKHECFCQICGLDELARKEEENIILSLPPCEALSILLPGLDIDLASKCMPLAHNGKRLTVGGHKTSSTTNIDNINCGKKIRINSCNPPINFSTKVNSSEVLLKGKPKTALPLSANVNLRMEENSISEIGEAITGTLSLSCTSSPISDECIQPEVDFELENDHCTDNDSTSITRSSDLYSGGSQHSSLIESTKTSSVNNNQKIGVLKSLGRDSSTYLEDYLQLLTSRPPPAIQQKTNIVESRVSDKSGSDKPLKDCKTKSQSRKTKTTSNSIARSLGSNYLDNYLVNLTDYSWIIYPTETKSPENSKAVTFDLIASENESSLNDTKSAGIKEEDSNYLRRKLHFIDPDKFFNRNVNNNKLNVSEGSLSLHTNSEDKECNSKMHNVADPATSPDISSSIFDQDIDDSCQKSIESTSLINLDDGKQSGSDISVQSDEMTEHHESKMAIVSDNSNSSSGVVSMSVNEVGESLVFENDKISNISTKYDTEVDKTKGMLLPSKLTNLSISRPNNNKEISEDSQILMASNPGFSFKSKSRIYSSFHGSGKMRLESNIEEETSSSSDISSATEPSTIVMAGDQHSLAPSDLEQSSLSSDLGKSISDSKIHTDSGLKNIGKFAHAEAKCVYDIESNKNLKSTQAENDSKSVSNLIEYVPNYERPNSSVSEVTQDDSLIESSESIGSVSLHEQKLSFLVEMLKARQHDEMNELIRRHDLEMQVLISNLKQLPEERVSLLANAYNSPNNNSLNELLDLKNIFSQSHLVTSTRSVTDTSNMIKDSCSFKESGTVVSPSIFPVSNHTNEMPSFFLHENRHESGKNIESENSQISQIFSLSRARIQCAPQTITDILTQHPNLGTDTNGSISNENTLVDTRSVSEPIEITLQKNQQSIKERNDSIMKRTLEAGLDLVPARESDLASIYDKMLSVAQRKAICKLQAAIRGRIIRKLMMTSQVQKLLSTLKEVAILAHRFHHDILTDNIQKGDVDFHKALFNEEQQTRDKLNRIMVELSPAEQIMIIHRNQIAEEKEAQRKAISPSKIAQPSVTQARSFSSKLRPVNQPNQIYSSKSSGIPSMQRCRNMKQISTHVIHEPSRPCQVNLSLDRKKQCLSPRDKRSTSIPAPKPLDVHRCVPKTRTCNGKKSSEIAKSHGPLSKNINSHLCKSESVLHTYGAAKISGNHRSPLQGDVCIARKPWR